MTMTETLMLALAWVAGGALGGLFFGGLWWTIRQGASSPRPAFWFLLSGLLRMGIVLGGFYVVSAGHWQRLLTCLLGFVMARLVVTRLTRRSADPRIDSETEKAHATQS